MHFADSTAPRTRRFAFDLLAPIVVVLCCGALVLAAPIPSNPTTATPKATAERPAETHAAIKKFEGGDIEGAYKLLVDVVKRQPQLPPARVMLANMFLTDSRFAEGRMQLERAVVEDPSDPEPHFTFGDLAIRDQRASDAEAQYDRGGELLKQFKGNKNRTADLTFKLHFGRFSVARLREQQVVAEKELRAALKLQPKHPGALRELGRVLFLTDKMDDAYKAFQAAEEVDKGQLPAELAMARLYQQTAQTERMVEWLKRGVEKSPKDVRGHVALAHAALVTHDLELAQTESAAAAKIDPKSADVRALLGTVARYRGDLPTAQRHLESAIEKAPGDFSSSNQLALVLADQGAGANLQRAITLAKFNLESNPRSPIAAATLGWVTYRAGNVAEAEQGLKAAMSAGDIGRDGTYFLARVLADRGRTKDAAKLLQRCLDSAGPFVHLADAEALQKELAGK